MKRHFTSAFPPAAWSTLVLSAVWIITAISSPGLSSAAHGQTVHWIWADGHDKDRVPRGACHFRKSFNMRNPRQGRIAIAADDQYELYVNGRRVGEGQGWKKFTSHDISRYLNDGRNVIAVKAVNKSGSSAALAARVTVRDRGGTHVSYPTDTSWKTSVRPLAFWFLPAYSDRRWNKAQSFGPVGSTQPWVDQSQTADQAAPTQFKPSSGFEIQEVIDHDKTGSLVAIAFNEFGELIASQENGPLLLISDSNQDQIPDKVRTWCTQVKGCQGILPLNGEVFVTGEGPEGAALYRLADTDRDGQLEIAATLIRFKGKMAEHGPHGLVLGPDGYIYLIVGNHSASLNDYAPTSPYRNFYDGDLVQPRLEDPRGHAAGIKAPGGVVIRTNAKGTKVELIAGGLRNPYDLAFNRQGDLFVHDSDMEWDEGTTWYRPTRILHITSGSEFGWRSGWAKWPDYYLDSLPAMTETGRGSPTGMIVYDHYRFPKKYHGALLVGDWAQGRILAVRMQQQGASYSTKTEVLVTGQPLNVTDLDIGPDGWLYFSTGGRDTHGSVMRVVWKGPGAKGLRQEGKGVRGAVRLGQIQSAWARQRVAAMKDEAGELWDQRLPAASRTATNPTHFRLRTLNLMQLFGPAPSPSLLLELSRDKDVQIRGKATDLMGLDPQEPLQARLVELLDDPHAAVRRRACEALVRSQGIAPLAKILPLLLSEDRHEVFAARRLLETIPPDQWRETVLDTKNPHLFVQGAMALVIAKPGKDTSLAVLDSASRLLESFINDADFVDLLRVIQVAIQRGELAAEDIAELSAALAEEFPAGEATINRELIRLLAHLQVTSIIDRYMDHLRSDLPQIEKLHLALHLGQLNSGWSDGQKLELLRYYEQALKLPGGSSLRGYVRKVSRALASTLTQEQRRQVLSEAVDMPGAALAALYGLPKQLEGPLQQELLDIDRQLAARTDKSSEQLKVGIIAVLARSGDARSMAYLREIYDRDPSRREEAAMGLAQDPSEENWPCLVRALPILTGSAAVEVLKKLQSIDHAPERPEHLRQAILCGLRLKHKARQHAVDLLQYWTGQQPHEGQPDEGKALAAWQKWFAQQYPDQPEPKLPVEADDSKWSIKQLLTHLNSTEGKQGSTRQGGLVFRKAQCANCHRFGTEGESMGPDLTSVARRFQQKEILQAILFPSHVISDQYASKSIITNDGQSLLGIVAPGDAGEIVILGTDGKKRILHEDDIDVIVPSKISAMPEGLLNSLTLQEITDLMAFLNNSPQTAITRAPGKTKQQ